MLARAFSGYKYSIRELFNRYWTSIIMSRLTGSKIRPSGQNACKMILFRNVIQMCQNTRYAALDLYCNSPPHHFDHKDTFLPKLHSSFTTLSLRDLFGNYLDNRRFVKETPSFKTTYKVILRYIYGVLS